ncbi:MAG TPA: helix-turn-helix domain-containing protein [Candidatus Eisenbacteria bacterium]|nr:helix-turn-helix domain-containing protein [Candidatus Eisenbacteria bacterium]
METPSAVLKKLGLSDSEIAIYLALTESGALTAAELVKATRGKRPTVYYALRQLIDRGLCHKAGGAGVDRFQAEPAKALRRVLDEREREHAQLAKDIDAIVPALSKKGGMAEGMPAVSFYEGEAAMRQAIMDTLYCRSRHIDSLAPADNFFWQAGKAFGAEYVRERVARKITTRNLWEKPLDPSTMRTQYAAVSKVRILPKSMHGRFRTTVFAYDDVVLYISSKKNGYALLVRSKEHVEFMRAMYDALWETATPVK